MTARERAAQYIAIFIGLGDQWRSCAPVDGEPTDRGIRIDGVEVWPHGDGTWRLRDGGRTWRYSLSPDRSREVS